jgi:hypothetical protein
VPSFRVQLIGLDGEVVDERECVEGDAERAALLVAGEPLIRGAKGHRKVLRAKVYWWEGKTLTLARFYRQDSKLAVTSELHKQSSP